MDSEEPTPKDAVARFFYLQWDPSFRTSTPYELLSAPPPGQPKSNLTFRPGAPEPVEDVRRSPPGTFTLDAHGFAYLRHRSTLSPRDFRSRAAIEGAYLPECEALLRAALDGVDELHVYNWRLRDSADTAHLRPPPPDSARTSTDPMRPITAALRVHVDVPFSAVLERIEEAPHLRDRRDYLLRGRVRHVNVWRPVGGPVEDCALAVCAGDGVPPEKLVEAERGGRGVVFVLPAGGVKAGEDGEGEDGGREEYEWYYMSGQRDDEPVLFKSYDSNEDVVGCKSGCPSSQTERCGPADPRSCRCAARRVQDAATAARVQAPGEHRGARTGLHVPGRGRKPHMSAPVLTASRVVGIRTPAMSCSVPSSSREGHPSTRKYSVRVCEDEFIQLHENLTTNCRRYMVEIHYRLLSMSRPPHSFYISLAALRSGVAMAVGFSVSLIIFLLGQRTRPWIAFVQYMGGATVVGRFSHEVPV